MFEYFASSVAFAEQTFAEACAALRETGVHEVDIWSVLNWCAHLPPNDSQPDLDGVKRTLAEHQLACRAISAYGKDSDEMLLARLEHLAVARWQGARARQRAGRPVSGRICGGVHAIRAARRRARRPNRH